jgi:1-acyl-sn-glycerol-3-phosphate acyltransferase
MIAATVATTLAAVSRVISGAAVEWRCDPRAAGQRIYFGNHSSHLDFIIIWSALPSRLRRSVRPVAGKDYWDKGPVRRYLAGQAFHAVLIERPREGSSHALTAARASIRRMADEIGDRHSLIVFPEGTRGLNGELGAFKSGLFHLSRLRPDAELIPVYLENLNRILPKGECLPVPMLSRVVFGPPLAARPGAVKPAIQARARDALIELRAVA